MQKPGLSLGLVIRNESHQIVEWLDQAAQFSENFIAEVLVVDNNSTDLTRILLDRWKKSHPDFPLQILHRKTNNMAKARNQILENAGTEWVYFTDADCRFEATAWQNLLHLFHQQISENPKAVAFGGGNRTPLTSSFVSQGLSEMTQNWWGHMNSIQVKPPTDARQVALLSTCNLLVKRTAALQCGGFDSAYHRVGEDMSLSHRLRAAGHDLLATPGIEVIHLQDRGFFQWCAKMFGYGQAQVFIAAKYPKHFLSLRGLQFALVLFAVALTFFFPMTLLWMVGGYFLMLVGLALAAKDFSLARLKRISFILISQLCYAAGEVWALVGLPFFILLNLPKMIPSLEKK